MSDFLRRYGVVMTSYIFIACAIWIFLMIVIPTGMMAYYTTWFIDDTRTGVLANQLRAMDKDFSKLERQERTLKREVQAAEGADRQKLEQELSVVGSKLEQLDVEYREVESAWDKSRFERNYSARNYVDLYQNENHRKIFLKTIWASVLVTLVALVFCYPIAYYMAQVAPSEQAAILMLGLVVPYWVNELLRVFAWQMILSGRGVLNLALSWFGLVDLNSIDPPPPNYLGDGGVIVGMVYAYILFMVFPLYNVIETLDRNQIEAARDLGASWGRIHWRIVIPHAKPGIAVGCIMTFMLAAGSYAVPMALSGGRSYWFTQVIYQWTNENQDLNKGAAYALVLLVLCIVFIMLTMRVMKVKLQDIAK